MYEGLFVFPNTGWLLRLGIPPRSSNTEEKSVVEEYSFDSLTKDDGEAKGPLPGGIND